MEARQSLQAIINLLKTVRKRKWMYFQPVDGTAATNFAAGVAAATHALGLESPEYRATWWQTVRNRGWEEQATGPLPQMEARGMTAEQKADEVLAIEIDTWRALQETTVWLACTCSVGAR
jgi:hypothetical protein